MILTRHSTFAHLSCSTKLLAATGGNGYKYYFLIWTFCVSAENLQCDEQHVLWCFPTKNFTFERSNLTLRLHKKDLCSRMFCPQFLNQSWSQHRATTRVLFTGCFSMLVADNVLFSCFSICRNKTASSPKNKNTVAC